jgi:hypothetical protein
VVVLGVVVLVVELAVVPLVVLGVVVPGVVVLVALLAAVVVTINGAVGPNVVAGANGMNSLVAPEELRSLVTNSRTPTRASATPTATIAIPTRLAVGGPPRTSIPAPPSGHGDDTSSVQRRSPGMSGRRMAVTNRRSRQPAGNGPVTNQEAQPKVVDPRRTEPLHVIAAAATTATSRPSVAVERRDETLVTRRRFVHDVDGLVVMFAAVAEPRPITPTRSRRAA